MNDEETYDLIFDQALHLMTHDDTTTGKLLWRIVNEWQKNPRSVPMPIMVAALDLAEEIASVRELEDDLRVQFKEPL